MIKRVLKKGKERSEWEKRRGSAVSVKYLKEFIES
jgi:hypothetical protein